MKVDETLELLKQGKIGVWNSYREKYPEWLPDLRGLDLSEIVLDKEETLNLSKANLCGTTLPNFGLFMFSNKRTLPNFEDALVDLSTKGIPLDFLTNLGAIFVTEGERNILEKMYSINIFISYAWANEKIIHAIDQWLLQRGLNTKIDKRNFFAGAKIRNEIIRHMSKSDVILLFYSKQAQDKPWIEFEHEYAADLEMAAKQANQTPPKIIYVVIDDTPLPDISAKSRIALMLKGKKFTEACEEIYDAILQIPRQTKIDLDDWEDFIF